MVETIRDRLLEDGMFFVGIDLIGDKVVEINAESPGGMQSVEHFSGIDFGLAYARRWSGGPRASAERVDSE